MPGSVRTFVWIAAVLVLGGGAFYWAFRPQPVAVDLESVERGTLEVTVSDDGRTRIRDIYAVSAPVSGTVRRAPGRVGDEVEAKRTAVAFLQPSAPAFLDARSRREAEAGLATANAAISLAEAQLREAESDAVQARNDYNRVKTLSQRNVASERLLEEAQANLARAEARIASAEATVEMRRRQMDSAEARLIGPETVDGVGAGDCCIALHSPIDGEILTIHHESETVVAAGTPLVEVGNRDDLEVVAELLSSEAVLVRPGAPALVERWGGPPLRARVHRVEPSGFTEVSALGIEEQRVRTVIELLSPLEERAQLGHGYRVVVSITIERHENVPLVSLGALFRQGQDWAVFVAGDGGRAVLRIIETGARDESRAMVLAGLSPGERVILHPSDRIAEGTLIEERQ